MISPPAHEDEHTHPHPRPATQSPEDRLRMIGESGVSGWAAAEGRTIVVPDVLAEPRFCWAWSDHGIQSAVLIPLQGRDRLIGMLEADSDRLNDFNAEDVVLLEALAAQLAIVIENAELLHAERSRSRRVATVTEIA